MGGGGGLGTVGTMTTPVTDDVPEVDERACLRSPLGVFDECPHCGGGMAPEHAHYRCTSCGWRDSCCD